VARGEKEWLGFPLNTIEGQIAIYLYGEGSIEENDNAILKQSGGEWPDGLVAERADGSSIEAYLEKYENYNVGLIVIDPDRTVYEGSESVSEVASPFYMKFEQFLMRKNCAGINSHHLVDRAEPKNLTDVAKGVRGSGVWADRPRCTLAILRMPNLKKTILGIPALAGVPQHNLGARAYEGILELGWDDDRECHILKQKAENKDIDFSARELDLVWHALDNWIDAGNRVTRTGKASAFDSEIPELKGLSRAFVRAAIDQLIADGRLVIEDGALKTMVNREPEG
jgi:hypothetical protein